MSDEVESTLVYTAEELQLAVEGGAAHIEIRAHLSLRALELRPAALGKRADPSILTERESMALLAARLSLKSLRGNCSMHVDGREWPGLQAEDAAGLLPLKPWQCLLVIDRTWLVVAGGSVWVDNLYLRLRRGTVNPAATFIRSGAYEDALTDARGRGSIYVSNVTFQGEHIVGARSAIALFTRAQYTDVLVHDCIFTDWAGSRSPLSINGLSVASVRSTVFRNIHLSVELADVSYGGTVSFQDVELAGVVVERGKVVGTTNNDYNSVTGCYLQYEAEDDEGYDVSAVAVPPAERGESGGDFAIHAGVMSDCLFLQAPRGAVLPGCPAQSARKRQRMHDGSAGRVRDPNAAKGVVCEGRVGARWRGGAGIGDLRDREWEVAAMMLELPEHPLPPPDWPPFALPPAAGSAATRASLRPAPTSAGLVPPICRDNACGAAALMPHPAPASPALTGAGGATAAVLAAAALLAVCLAVVLWRVRATYGRWPDATHDPEGRPRSVRGQGGHGRILGMHGTAAPQMVCTGVPEMRSVIPKSALNPDYEYALPPHLALLATRHTLQNSTTGTRPSSRTDGIILVSGRPSKSQDCSSWARRGRGAAAGPGSHTFFNGPQMHERAQTWDSAKSMQQAGGEGAAVSATQQATRWTTMAAAAAAASRCETTGGAAHACMCDGDDEPGTTVVPAPYTVSTCTVSAQTLVSEDVIQSSSRAQHGHAATRGTAKDTRSASTLCTAPVAQHSICKGSHCLGTTEGDAQDMHGCYGADFSCQEQPHAHVGTERPGHHDVGDARMQQKPTNDGDAAELGRLHRQLDRFGEGDVFLGQFTMRGRQHRRRGGQAVVQFADGRGDGCEYAVKFFLSAADFHAEAALYAACHPFLFHSPTNAARAARCPAPAAPEPPGAADGLADRRRLGDTAARFLPQVEAVCEEPRDPTGRLLPPCIVMEKGESLQEWSNRAEPDLFTAVAVLSHVSKCLADMHDAGFVHRDLKPANVMWLPRENRWTVIDFGCVARVGTEAPLSFTLAYAAPEAVHALTAGRKAIVAAAALDAWSLGVMAFELLTGEPAFQLLTHGCEQVVAMLTGDLPLPWEGGLSAQHAQRLGAFKAVVLQLLRREPGERLGARPFHAACTELFATHTTITA